MIRLFVAGREGLRKIDVDGPLYIPAETVWIDMVHPTLEEEKAVETVLLIDVPTREEMQEIEVSSRLYEEDGNLYMTATVMTKADTDQPEANSVTFILAKHKLVTVRYAEPLPFKTFSNHVLRHPGACQNGEAALMGLLEAVIDRIADILEHVGTDLEQLSRLILTKSQPAQREVDFRDLLHKIGRSGDLSGKLRESAVSLGRVISFIGTVQHDQTPREIASRTKVMVRDLQSLNDHATFLSGKIAFLLDATLGMLNIEQNNIIKLFSVVSAVFLPPTLIASIYGMNFQHMPELEWGLGYPLSLLLMVISAVVPYWLFKRKGWL